MPDLSSEAREGLEQELASQIALEFEGWAQAWWTDNSGDLLAGVAALAAVRTLIAKGWQSPEQVAARGRQVLLDAADEIARIRRDGLDSGMESHPTSELFERWLRGWAGEIGSEE